MKILLLHPGALGDILLSLPALAMLRGRFPSAALTIAGNVDHIAPVIPGYAERVVSLSALPVHRLYSPEPPLPEDMRFWKSFDLIVSWTGSGDQKFIEKLGQIHPDAIVASWRPRPGQQAHVSQLFARSLGFDIANLAELPPAGIHLDSTTRSAGLQWLADHGWNERDYMIALHPGAGSEEKRWPLERFAGLARHLGVQERGKLLIIGGPAEPGLAKQLVQGLPEERVMLAESITLGMLAGVLQHCKLYIGNDSGIAHLAAGSDVPSIVLFGPTLPQHWAPLGRHVVVLRDPRDCEGCNGRGRRHTCLENITIEQVIRNLEIGRLDEASL